MKPTHFALALTLIATVGFAGCGGSAEYEFPEATQTVTKVETFRSTLQDYATSGQLSSGIELLIGEADSLSAEGVSNTAEIKTKLQELSKAGSPNNVRKIAKEILELLPASAATANG